MIKNITVLGAGTMGHAIANVFAMHGYKVNLYETFEAVRSSVKDTIRAELEFMVQEDYLEPEKVQETLDNISLYDDLNEAAKDADYVIEATPENMELKQDLFTQLDAICPAHTIFASNTSSLPLSGMTEKLPDSRKAKTMICHWYNPGHLIPIAELSCFGNMSEEDFNDVYDLYVRAGKQPVKVLKDVPGLVANRMLHAMAREVFSLIENGVASAEDIDKALKFGPGFRSATTGILESADMGGLDVWCACEDNLFPVMNNFDRACDMMRRNVEAGNLGLKTGKGFYEYSDEKKTEAQTEFNRRLIVQLKASENYK